MHGSNCILAMDIHELSEVTYIYIQNILFWSLTRSEEVIERICDQPGQGERHEDVLRNQECRKMFDGASRGIDLREVYLRCPTSPFLKLTSKSKGRTHLGRSCRKAGK
jgi:hypothetical protein